MSLVNEIFSRELRWGINLQISKVSLGSNNLGKNLRIFEIHCGVNLLIFNELI